MQVEERSASRNGHSRGAGVVWRNGIWRRDCPKCGRSLRTLLELTVSVVHRPGVWRMCPSPHCNAMRVYRISLGQQTALFWVLLFALAFLAALGTRWFVGMHPFPFHLLFHLPFHLHSILFAGGVR